MKSEFPYQLTVFLDKIPQVGETVYGGEHGWYAQVALKRRFGLVAIDETQLLEKLEGFFAAIPRLTIQTGEVYRPERMPVSVVRVRNDQDLIDLHQRVIKYLGNDIVSKFSDREGDAYLPHVTAEYGGEWVIDTENYIDSNFEAGEVWLLKDVEGEDSVAYAKFATL